MHPGDLLMRRVIAVAVLLLSSGAAFASQSGTVSSNYASITQGVDGIRNSLVIQQAQISQNTQNSGRNTHNWTGISQYVTNVSDNSFVIQGATINNTSINSTPSFHNGGY
jgi:hypothetical protein